MTAPRYPVEIRPLAPRARFEAAGHPDALPAALRAAGLVLPSRPNSSADCGAMVRVDWLGPRRFVVSAPLDAEDRLANSLLPVFAGFELADVCCTTDMVASFELLGAGVADVLAQGTPLDVSRAAFAAGSVTVTDLWGVSAIIERPGGAADCLRVTVDRSLAGYVEGWLRTASGLHSPLQPGVMRTARAVVPRSRKGTPP